MPRGSKLTNSDEVYALVVYTGHQTKLSLNQGTYQIKISYLSKLLNYYVLWNVLTLTILDIFMA
jgi:hypothetical protein